MFENLLVSWTFYAVLAAAPLLYWYFTRNYDYFVKRGIKGPKPLPLFGNFLDNVRLNLIDKEELYAKEYGKIYGFFRGQQMVLTVCEPELIKQILVKDFNKFSDRGPLGNVEHEILKNNLFACNGEQWKRIRSLVSPTFTTSRMKKMRPLVNEAIDNFFENLTEKTSNGKTELNVKKEFGGLTMEVIASCAFATKLNTAKEPDHPFLINAGKMIQANPRNAIPAFIFPRFINDLIGVKSVFDNKALEFVLRVVRHVIADRKTAKDNVPNDLLQLLINAGKADANYREEEDKYEAHHLNEGEEEVKAEQQILFSNNNGTKLKDNEIIAQAHVFFVAGYETTATSLTWAALELALNPSVQERLYNEIASAEALDYDLIARLPYLDAVIAETLRLHNPAVRINRMCVEDCEVGDFKILKGMQVEISVHAVHHNEEFHPEPYKFNPDRFLPENRHKIIPYTYLPFGAGPRSCIGMRFALMEAKWGLAYIIKHFKFSKSPNTPLNPQTNHLFLNIPNDVYLYVEKR